MGKEEWLSETQEEWEEWVAQGEDLSPYIPTPPDEYYSGLGKWRGWSFFPLGIVRADDDPSWGPDGKGPIITRWHRGRLGQHPFF